jgi:hypothetical protein
MYAMETLPAWFWLLFYAYFLASIMTSINALRKKRLISWSVLHICFMITIQPIGIVNAIERVDDNEFEHFIRCLKNLELWSIYVLVGYVYSLFWWGLYFFINKRRTSSD